MMIKGFNQSVLLLKTIEENLPAYQLSDYPTYIYLKL